MNLDMPMNMMRMCFYSYNYFTPELSGAGVEIYKTHGVHSTIYAFRGTENNYSDIASDMKGWWTDDRALGKCHTGFLIGVRIVWLALFHSLHDDNQCKRDIYFCGHSKGGAEATIAAALTVTEGFKVSGLLTAGSPRPGFQPLADILAPVETIRIVRGKDAIPGKPWSLWGYRHVGKAIHIGKRKNRWTDHRIAGYVDDYNRYTKGGK